MWRKFFAYVKQKQYNFTLYDGMIIHRHTRRVNNKLNDSAKLICHAETMQGLTKSAASHTLDRRVFFHEVKEMKEIKTWSLAFTYVGCFLGAGFISGQELWQFFGSFGNLGYVGFLLAVVLFSAIGILFVRLTQMTQCSDMDRLLVPWNVKWLRAASGAVGAVFLFFVVVSMSAGVGAMLAQLFDVSAWLGSAVFMALVFAVALLGVTGMVNAFSALIPVLITATVAFAVGAYATFGTEGVFQLRNVNNNPLMPNWFIAALTFVSYNILGGIGIMSPVGQYVRRKRHIYGGIILAGVMLLAVAGSILTSLASYPEAVAAELPMVALASRLNGTLGTVYGLMLLLAMFCNALASLVGLIAYLEQKARFVREKKKPVLAGLCVLAWCASLLGFGEIIAVVYPIFGYLSIVFIVCMVVHFVQCRKKEKASA